MRIYPQLSGPRNSQILRDVAVVVTLALVGALAWWVRGAVLSLTDISSSFTDGARSAQEGWTQLSDALGSLPLVGDELERAMDGLAAATLGNAVQTGRTITAAVTVMANVLGFVMFAAPAVVLMVLWLPRRIDRARRWDAAERVLSAVAVSPVFASAVGAGEPAAVGPAAGPASATAVARVATDVRGPGAGTADDHSTLALTPPGAADDHDTLALPRPGAAAAAAFRQPGAGLRDVRLTATGEAEVQFPPDELLALRALCNLPLESLVRFSPRPFEAFAAGDYAPLVAALYAHEGLVPPGWSDRS